MRFFQALVSLLFVTAIACGTLTIDDLQKQALDSIQAADAINSRGAKKCTLANAAVRRDWYVTPSHLFFSLQFE